MNGVRFCVLFAASAALVSAASVPDRAIRHLGGSVVKYAAYEESVAGLQKYLRDSGVRKITAEQITRPHHPEVAREHGYSHFVPRREWWPRGVALALLAEAVAEAAGEPVTIRNWWRPERYNRDPRVAGAGRSDHLSAHAVDLDYRSTRAAERGRRWLEELRRENPWLRLSIGSGARTAHVGIDSPLGSRSWTYSQH